MAHAAVACMIMACHVSASAQADTHHPSQAGAPPLPPRCLPSMTSSLSEWWPMMCNKMNVYIDILWYFFHLTQVAYALRAAEQPGLARRRFRPASLARVRDARPAHDDGGRDRSRSVAHRCALTRGIRPYAPCHRWSCVTSPRCASLCVTMPGGLI